MTADGSRASARLSLAAAGGVLLVGLLQVLSEPSWIYPGGGVDQWFYPGLFVDLRNHMAQFPGTYYGTRLAWILPGHLAYTLLSPLAANLALRLYLHGIALMSVFFFARREGGLRCAIAMALLLASSPDWLSAAGWDYVDGPVIAYTLLAVEEFGAASAIGLDRTAGKWRLFFCGAAMASAVHSNVTILFYLPLLGLLGAARVGRRLLHGFTPFVLGAGAITCVFGLVNRAFGGAFVFFVNSFAIAPALLTLQHHWRLPFSEWGARAWWLVVPFAVSAAGVAFVVRAGRKDPRRSMRILALPAALLGVGLWHWQGNTMLEMPFYCDYLIVPLVLSAVALVGDSLDAIGPRQWNWTLLGGVALALFVGTSWAPRPTIPFAPSTVWLALALAALLGLATFLRRGPAVVVAFASLATGLAILADSRLDGSVAGRVGWALLRAQPGAHNTNGPVSPDVLRDRFSHLHRTLRRIADTAKGERLWFWYSFASDPDSQYTSLASTSFWDRGYLNTELPQLTAEQASKVGPGQYIAIMDDRPEMHVAALRRLAELNIRVEPVDRLDDMVASSVYRISLVKVRP